LQKMSLFLGEMKNVNKIEETYSSSWSFIHSY